MLFGSRGTLRALILLSILWLESPRAGLEGVHSRVSAERATSSASEMHSAKSLVLEFAAALNRQDLHAVAKLLRGENDSARVEAARFVVRDYRLYFSDRPVVRVEALAGGEDAQHLYFELHAVGGLSKTIAVYSDPWMGGLRLYDEFILYSPRVHPYVAAVIEAIRAQDAERLARLLTVDDLDYPAHLAEQAIAAYRERFDLETLRIRFDGLGQDPVSGWLGARVQRPFVFTAWGSRQGQLQSYPVLIRHGDGLIEWHDSLVPAVPQ